jgi:uroporphyrin-III C-methyltransferase / precorrin-2 dehydrogenase / sirohydrochlorin ferrochelatase
MYLPLVFKGDGLRCLIIGGGEVALRKLELMLEAGCEVTVLAPHIHDEVQSAIAARGVRRIAREFCGGDCRGYQLVIAATERREINRAVYEESKSLCIPVNVADDPELCTVIFPAVWRQGPLTISVTTGGVAPFMAAVVRDRLALHGASLAGWVEAAAKFRAVVRSEAGNNKEKGLLYQQFVDAIRPGDPPDPPESQNLSEWIAWLEKLKA